MEKKFNIKIPDSFVDFIIKNNGGYIENNTYTDEKISFTIDVFLSIKYGELTLEETIEDHQVLEDNIPKDLMPFALDDGGNCYCIGIDSSNYDKVYKWYFDTDKNQKILLEDCFNDFLSKFS
ncbi:hypothetical protein IWQ47_002092 [Aquimarina sp. EL_43]|nr:hypothetical protein [Aquimarina sp. EL_35]MBG6151238.1 hypothetical protein [Aquimarina sp. EL_32]MBG6169018.1 hypothetical protein [Aquimarina sp. EL_43]